MKRIAQFEIVSFSQFKTSYLEIAPNASEEEIQNVHQQIKKPKRATKFSAGYDFFAPFDLTITTEPLKIPTGIRVKIDDSYFLSIFPRSGLGFKYGLRLLNTVGIIDADYFNSSNEGHIFIKVRADQPINIKQGEGFAQGIFLEYGVTIDDQVEEIRDGGFGSTTKR